MNLQPATILRDTAFALVPVVAVAWVAAGSWVGLGALVTGLALLVNLWVLGKVVHQLTAYLAGENPNGTLAMIVLVVKFPLALLVVSGLAAVFGGFAVLYGLLPLVLALFVRGVLGMFQQAPAAADPAPES